MTTGFARLGEDARRVLAGWRAPDDLQEALRRDFLAALAARPGDACAKAGPPVHLTASCLVLDAPRRRTLLTLHRRARAWFQPGGHLEPADAGVGAAAAREAREETGLAGLRLSARPVHLDRHDLVGDFGTCRTHLDVRYVALAPDGARASVGEESLDLRWFELDELDALGDPGLVELARRGAAADVP